MLKFSWGIHGGKPVPGLYVAGWIKRGPTGIIGTNRADSVATVASLMADFPNMADGGRKGGEGLKALLAGRNVRVVTFQDWQTIDAAEIKRGEPKGKPREKFTRVAEMLGAIG